MKRLLVPLVLGLLGRPVLAEDPFLGQIKAIKCVGCRPGWVDIVVHDPIDVRDFDIAVKDVDYYKVVSPLPGKKIHDKDGACFYWFDAPKGWKQPSPKPKPLPPAQPAPPPLPQASDSAAVAAPKDSSARGDSAAAPMAAPVDSSLVPPPALAEPEGPPPTPSRCIPYVRPAPAAAPGKADK
jgi:hypothetical protein